MFSAHGTWMGDGVVVGDSLFVTDPYGNDLILVYDEDIDAILFEGEPFLLRSPAGAPWVGLVDQAIVLDGQTDDWATGLAAEDPSGDSAGNPDTDLIAVYACLDGEDLVLRLDVAGAISFPHSGNLGGDQYLYDLRDSNGGLFFVRAIQPGEFFVRNRDTDEILYLADDGYAGSTLELSVPLDFLGRPARIAAGAITMAQAPGEDNVELDLCWAYLTVDPVAAAPPPAPRRALLPPHPNPFNPRLTVPLAIGAEGRYRLEVLDAGGRRVAVLHAGTLSPGRHDIAWDGRDGAGRRRASGLYLIRLASGDWSETRRVLLLK